jgi:hypothetical protein
VAAIITSWPLSPSKRLIRSPPRRERDDPDRGSREGKSARERLMTPALGGSGLSDRRESGGLCTHAPAETGGFVK